MELFSRPNVHAVRTFFLAIGALVRSPQPVSQHIADLAIPDDGWKVACPSAGRADREAGDDGDAQRRLRLYPHTTPSLLSRPSPSSLLPRWRHGPHPVTP